MANQERSYPSEIEEVDGLLSFDFNKSIFFFETEPGEIIIDCNPTGGVFRTDEIPALIERLASLHAEHLKRMVEVTR